MSEKPTKKFLCSYHHGGAQWSLEIDAYDWADAEARVSPSVRRQAVDTQASLQFRRSSEPL